MSSIIPIIPVYIFNMKGDKVLRSKFIAALQRLKKVVTKNFTKIHQKCTKNRVFLNVSDPNKMDGEIQDPNARPARGRGLPLQNWASREDSGMDRLGRREERPTARPQAAALDPEEPTRSASIVASPPPAPSATPTPPPTRIATPSTDSESVRESPAIPKQGSCKKADDLLANCYRVVTNDSVVLRQFSVAFEPPTDSYMMKKAMFYLTKKREETFGAHLYDGGAMLYSISPNAPDHSVAFTFADRTQLPKDFNIVITPVHSNAVTPQKWAQLYNSLLKQSLYDLGYKRIGKNFFNLEEAEMAYNNQLRIVPGIVTTIRQHEVGLLLNVETINKVIRMKTVLDLIEERRSSEGNQRMVERKVEEEVLHAVVMTIYNTRTYSIASIDWNADPASTFLQENGEETDFVTYYQERYGLNAKPNQPLMLAAPKKRDFHKAKKDDEVPKKILLLPQFCQLVGLTPAMRSDFNLMKSISSKLLPSPEEKVNAIRRFREKLDQVPEVTNLWKSWKIRIGTTLISVPGRVFPLNKEKIIFGDSKIVTPTEGKGEWNNAFRKERLFVAAQLKSWSIIYPERNEADVKNMVSVLRKVSKTMGLNLVDPNFKAIQAFRTTNYLEAINAVVAGKETGLVFVVLASDNSDTYGAIKKKLTVELGIPSQCFLAKKLKAAGLMSIVTKVAVQMNSKLGGESWSAKIPITHTMIVGQVMERCKKTKGFISATVATLSQSSAKFFSAATKLESSDELTQSLPDELGRCLEAYRSQNEELPKYIFLYLEGYSDGDLERIGEFHIPKLRMSLVEVYSHYDVEPPQFTVMAVNRSPGMRILKSSANQIENPSPGTVVDEKITLPKRQEFYLIPQSVRQGTVTPTSFVVLFDDHNIGPNKLQSLSYKCCNAYFNCFCTIAIPAPCQYARRLATQLVTIDSPNFNRQLSHSLFYL